MSNNKIVILVLAILGIIVGYWIINKPATPTTVPPVTNFDEREFSPETASTSISLATTSPLEIATSSKSKIQGPAPDLDHTVIFSADFPNERKVFLTGELTKSKAILRGDIGNWNAWIDLANQVSTAGDNQYTIEIFNFVAKNLPAWGLPYSNLGMIYGYHLHDNVQAEKSFKMALAREPGVSYYYIQLYQFYTDIDQLEKAKDILRQAISKKVPDYLKLKELLDSLELKS